MTRPEAFNFDLIDACGYGYVRVWNERQYLIKLALVPVAIKFIAAIAVYMLGYQENILRQGLVMLPAALAQGWVLAQFLRTLLMEERWPQALPTTRDDAVIAKLVLRARGIVSSTLVFVLIQLMLLVVIWAGLQLDTSADPALQAAAAETAPPTVAEILMIIPAVAFLLLSIWAFRLNYIYIPYVVLMPAREYLARISGFMTSVKMIGLFLVTMVPIGVTASLLGEFIFTLLGDTPEEPSNLAQFIVMLLRSVTDMVVALISTTAMAYALRLVVPHHPDALKDVSGGGK